MKPEWSRTAEGRGFTLIELMVAVAVLSLVTLILTSLVQSTASVWRTGQLRVDNYTKARLALDLAAQDVAGAVLMAGLPEPVFDAPNRSFSLMSKRPGMILAERRFGGRNVAYVTYRLERGGAADVLGLQRGDAGYDFLPGALTASVPPVVPTLAAGLFPSGAYQSVGPGVLGFTAVFLRQDGTLHPDYLEGETVGIFLAVVVADPPSLQLLGQGGRMASLVAVLDNRSLMPNGTAREPLPRKAWTDALAPLQANWPPPLLSGVRIFQRYVKLPESQ